MGFEIRRGIFPTMITPYTEDNKLDFKAIEEIVDYYRRSGCVGIFAVCQSSEMYFLTDHEKKELMKCVSQVSGGELQLVASGHTADDIDTQIRQLALMAENGAHASVMVLNRLAKQNEKESVVKKNIETILNTLPDITFGIYECPYPYKRIASPDLMRWCAETGRIVFIKDTCCSLEQLAEKQKVVEGTPLKIYNANTATLLDSYKIGIYGYSGVMANFHADLYTALLKLIDENDPRAADLHRFLTLTSLIEYHLYPVCAKYRMQMEGLHISLISRMNDHTLWNSTFELEVKIIYNEEQKWREKLGLN